MSFVILVANSPRTGRLCFCSFLWDENFWEDGIPKKIWSVWLRANEIGWYAGFRSTRDVLLDLVGFCLWRICSRNNKLKFGRIQ